MTVTENLLIAWSRSLFAVAVVGALATLGIANVATYSRWHEVEDGVFWSARAEGVTASDFSIGSPAKTAGLQRGDVLLAINGQPVQTPSDVIEVQHRSHEGTTLTYTVLRLASQQALQIALTPAPRGPSMYYALAAVGLFTLLVGASVRLRRPGDQATLHFFWLCVAFFGVFSFSFTGPLDRLDWAFYWGDAMAFALLPPLLLHFTLVFPERPSSRAIRESALVPLIYAPAFALGIARVVTIARGSSGSLQGVLVTRVLDALDRAEPIYLFVCVVAALAALFRAFGQITSLTGRRQLRWIAWGTALGVGPFAVGYALPWALGFNPTLTQFTAVLLGLVPVTFACAIVRYRLRDVEVIIKSGLTYAAFLGASGALYGALLKLTGFVF